MTVSIVNYEAGNLGSVLRALRAVGCEGTVADTPDALDDADRIILPGVGNFRDAMERLQAGGWVPKLRELAAAGRPLLGICVGMQVLAEAGTESSEVGAPTPGLGLVMGTVQRLDALGSALRVPQQGWNSLAVTQGHALLAHIPGGTDVYFSNSFALPAASPAVAATVDYGVPIAAAVAAGNVMGIQFHPEKSSRAGLRVLRNFLEYPC
ncbi:MAG: imidazole glycerol phosphate synthase subunit HisH [Comamonadaceae bacterium]|nr:MAG: imidazole glycerol phosphate synthase subunit HisH [Comamonadaceae bacterium]